MLYCKIINKNEIGNVYFIGSSGDSSGSNTEKSSPDSYKGNNIGGTFIV